MKRWRHLFAILVLAFGADAGAAPYPSASQLRDAITTVAQLLNSDGIKLEIVDARTVGLTLPLLAAGMTPTGETCRVFYNTTPEPGLTEFFATFDDADLSILLGALAVHEAMHCFEQREAFFLQRFAKIMPADFKPETVTVQGYLSVVKSGALVTWGEALADIASVLHLQQVVPDRWTYFAASLAAMRRDLAGKWPEHDTSQWLDRVIAAAPAGPAQLNLFETALQLRSQYRPRP
jgi:hypothetical protein